jgi:hypothetical protein
MIALGGTFKARESRNYKKPERFQAAQANLETLWGARIS